MTRDLTFFVFSDDSLESTLRTLRSLRRQRDAEYSLVLMLREPFRDYATEIQTLVPGVRSYFIDADMPPIETLRRAMSTVDTALICPLSDGTELVDGWVDAVRTGVESFSAASVYCGPVFPLFARGV